MSAGFVNLEVSLVAYISSVELVMQTAQCTLHVMCFKPSQLGVRNTQVAAVSTNTNIPYLPTTTTRCQILVQCHYVRVHVTS